MSRPATELALYIEAIARDLEATERETYRRRMMPALELELITMRAELKHAKGLS